jgi:SAM-dependent methyltransferase
MTASRDELLRIERLRQLFLDDERATSPLPDYWRDAADLAAYDRALAARIGWKWDAALAECRERGFARADGERVLDFGCGTGIAARRFAAHFGAREVWCHDRSPAARNFAVERLRAEVPAVAARAVASVDDLAPDVLLVSHVLGELDDAGRVRLRELIARSRRVVLVEPGSRVVSRQLSTLRDQLLADFVVIAPCPHANACPSLVRTNDWCHFFAAPPPEVFTDGDQVRLAKALGIDARSLPYSFLALQRSDAAAPRRESPPQPDNRLLGRPHIHPHTVAARVCTATGLVDVELQRRREPQVWRELKKHPERVRTLPLPDDRCQGGPAPR